MPQAPTQQGEKTLVDAILAGEVSLDDALTHYRPPTGGERVQTFAGVLARAAGDAYRSGTSAELRIAERGLKLIGADSAADWMRGFADYVAPGGDLGKDVAATSRSLGNPAMGFIAAPSVPAAAQNDSKVAKAFTQYLPEGIGSSVGMIALPGPGGLGGVALRGAFVGAGQQFVEAKAAGADDDAAWIAFAGGAALGATEAGLPGKWATPLGKLLSRADAGSGGGLRAAVWEWVKGGAKEFTQEALQTVGENLLAQHVYDEDRELIQGVIEGGTGGALTGLLLGALAGGAHGGSAADAQRTDTDPESVSLSSPSIEEQKRDTVDVATLSPAAVQAAEDLGVDPASLEHAPEGIREFVGKRGGEVYVARGSKKAGAIRDNAMVVSDSPDGLDTIVDHEVAHLTFQGDPEAAETLRRAVDTLAPEVRSQVREDYLQDALTTKRQELDRELTPEEEQAVRAESAPAEDEELAVLAQDFSGLVRLLRKNPEAFAKLKDPSAWRSLVRGVTEFGSNVTFQDAPEDLTETYKALAGRGYAAGVEPKVGVGIAKALGSYLDSLVGKAPRVEAGQQAATAVEESPAVDRFTAADQKYRRAGDSVDGRSVRQGPVDNTESISASLNDYDVLPGIREVPMSEFALTGRHYSVRGTERIAELAEEIKASGEITPLIVVEEAKGPYILEGSTRVEALYRLGAKSFPALVAVDNESSAEGSPVAAPAEVEAESAPQPIPETVKGPSFALYRRAFPTSSGASIDWDTKDNLLRLAQDAWRPVGRWRDALAAAGKVTDANDIVLMEELRRGRTLDRVKDETATHVAPLRELILTGPVTLDDADTYLLARAAPGRNALVQGRTGQTDGSGFTDADALAITQAAETGPNAAKYAEIAAAFDRLTNRKLEIMEQTGLISADEATQLRTNEPKYAPQKSDQRAQLLYGEKERSVSGIGRTRRKEFKSALGRKSKADSPIVFATLDLMAAIERGAWNSTVGASLLDLARTTSDPKVVTVDQRPTKQALVNGAVQTVPDMSEKANEIVVKEAGVPRVVRFGKGWELVATAIKGADSQTGGVLVDNLVRKPTRALASLSTSWNPAFWPVNFARDILGAGLNAATDFGPAESFAIIRGVGSAFKEAATNGPWMQRFVHSGGPISFLDIARTFEEEMRRTVREIVPPNGPWEITRRQAGKLRTVLEKWGNVFENATRLAAFRYLVEQKGWSDARAAQYAKNLTTNFEKRGTAAWMNSFYAFSNAGVQGSSRVVKALRTPWGQRLAAGLVVGAFTLSMLNRVLGGDDDDGVPRWDKVPLWQRRTNLILLFGDTKVMVPLPFVWNIIHAAGTETERAMFGGQDNLDTITGLSSTFAGVLNPLGGEGDVLNTLSPTLLDPFLQIERNQDYAGRQIIPETYGAQKPDSQIAWDTTSPWLVAAARKLNEMSGGDAGRSGFADFSPASLEFLAKQMFGGAGGEVSRVMRIAEKIASGEDMEWQDVPTVRRFVGSLGLQEQRDYYKSQRDLVRRQVGREKAGEPYDRDLWRMRKRVDAWDERIGDLHDELRKEGADINAIRAKLREVYLAATEAIRNASAEDEVFAR